MGGREEPDRLSSMGKSAGFYHIFYLLLFIIIKIILGFFFPLIWCIRLCDCCILNQPFILRLINLIWWWHNFLIPFWIWLNNIFVCIFHVYINDRYWPVVYFLVDSDFNIKVTLASLRCEAIFPLLLCGRFWEELLLFLLSIISRRIAEAIHSWVFLFMSSFVGNIFFVCFWKFPLVFFFLFFKWWHLDLIFVLKLVSVFFIFLEICLFHQNCPIVHCIT